MPAKKPVKKTTTKSKSVRKPIHKSVKKTTKGTASTMRSFRLSREPNPFTTFRVTRQTFYWLVFSIVVFVFAIWILNLQLQIIQLTDSINFMNY